MKNLLMIVVDDLRPELNCFGRKKLVTPNLDRLAARSTRFDRAYCQFPQCMPSRVSALTGIRPGGFCNWTSHLARQGEPTLPGWLQSKGMKTCSVGKVYHEPLDDAVSWSELHMDTFEPKPHGGMTQAYHDYQDPANQAKYQTKRTMTIPEIRKVWEPLPPILESVDAPEENYLDHVVASRAIDCLRRHAGSDKGLFLAAGFYRPHLPWVAPKKYWDLYDREEVDLADNPFFPENAIGKSDLCDLLHHGDREIQETCGDVARYEGDDFPELPEAKQRELIHAYWACTSFMDAQVGRLLDALEDSGMAEETAVVFWGDNGWHLGEHKLWSKVTSFDESTRVPLLLSVPGVTDGSCHDGLVEMVDLYPTACDLLGLDRPEHLVGRALPGVPGAVPEGKDEVFTVSWTGPTLLTPRFRLTWYPGARNGPSAYVIGGRGEYELFDHENDRRENRNVAGDPAYAGVLAELRGRLHAWYDTVVPENVTYW